MIAADSWNKLVALVKRGRPLRGVRCETKEQPSGVVVSGDASGLWRHPWFIEARHEFNEDGSGEWRGFVRPGFVNGRDAYITMPADWPDGKLPADETAKPLARVDDDAEPQAIELPERAEVYPGRFPKGLEPSKVTASTPSSSLPRPSALLPAVHDAMIADLSVPLPSVVASAGNVFVNVIAGPILIPGGGGRRPAELPVGGYAASDGRAWYRVTRAGITNSFFPTDFERELFLLHFNEAQWRSGGRIQVAFSLELQLMKANTRGQIVVVIEAGSAPKQTTPAPTGENLENIVWAAAPLLAQRLVISEVPTPHRFGAIVKRALADDTLSAERLHYTTWTAAPADSVPATTGVVLRARLIQFDTENNVKGASGFIRYAFTDAKAEIV